MYLLLSFLTGMIIVVNMMLNAKISKQVGQLDGILTNYFSALLAASILCAFHLEEMASLSALARIPLLYFIGGLIGVLTTYLFNLIIPRLPSFQVVVLRFIGQMLAGAVIDFVYFDIFSKGKILGGMLFLTGLLINAKADTSKNDATSDPHEPLSDRAS